MFPFRAAVVACLLVSAQALAANADLDRAEKFFEQLKYPDAEKALVKALAVPRNDRQTVLRIYELRGIIDATIGKKSALEHFRKLVSIDPERVLSRDFGPRILAPFYEAKARLDESPPIKLVATATLAEGSQQLHVALETDALKLGQKLVLYWKQADGTWTSRGGPVKAGPIDQVVQADTVDWYAELLGVADGLLLQSGTADQPLHAAPPLPVPTITVSDLPAGMKVVPVDRPMSTQRKISIATAAVGAGALIGAGIFGLSSRIARGEVEAPPRDDQGRLIGMTAARAQQLEAQTTNSAIAANVLLGTGGGLLALATILFFAEPAPKVALVPGPGGIAVVGRLP